MTAADRLAVEHLTAPSASPLEIVELAASLGCAAATVLVAPFAAFPQTAGIDLVADAGARRAVREAAVREGLTLALAYPFVLSRRTPAASLRPTLETAAEIGAKGVGFLVYDRDPARAGEETAAFCALATSLGLRPVLEFIPVAPPHLRPRSQCFRPEPALHGALQDRPGYGVVELIGDLIAEGGSSPDQLGGKHRRRPGHGGKGRQSLEETWFGLDSALPVAVPFNRGKPCRFEEDSCAEGCLTPRRPRSQPSPSV